MMNRKFASFREPIGRPVCRPLRILGPSAFLLLAIASAGLANAADEEKPTAIKAKRILPFSGPAIDGGVVLIKGGKVVEIGANIAIPDGAKVIDLPDAVITPGLIDANCIIGFEIPQVTDDPLLRGAALERNSVDPAMPSAAQRTSLWKELAHADRKEQLHALVHPHDDGVGAADERGADDGCLAVCGGWAYLEKEAAAADAAPFVQVWAEQNAEVVPNTRVLDSVNLYSTDFKRLLRSGVTTVYISPDSGSVIGARGAIVKTGGPLATRVVRDADAVKATMGEDPSSRGRNNNLPPFYGPPPTFFTRRPTTRMGVDFVFRKAFYDADRASRDLPLSGADAPPEEAIPFLLQVRKGEIPLRIQARKQHDILGAIRLSQEFKLPFILEEGTESYKCLPELKAAGVPVVFGPLFMSPTGWRAYSGEANEPRLSTPRLLLDSGIPFALSAQERRDEEGLVRQAMFAAAAGLPVDEALKAVTTSPARLLRLPENFGTLSKGAAADLVAWSGDPLSADSQVQLVAIDGRVVFERD